MEGNVSGVFIDYRYLESAENPPVTPKRDYGETETSRVFIIALLDVEAMWLNCQKTLHPHFLPA